MAAYIQMGHHSENLVSAPGLENFLGVIISPVNRSLEELKGDISKYRKLRELDILFDPQLYCPQSQRGHLTDHAYYPSDIDSAEIASEKWWESLIADIGKYGTDLRVNGICTPTILPKKSNPDYFARCVLNYALLSKALRGTGVRPIMTIYVNLDNLTDHSEVYRIASSVTVLSVPTECYLVVETDTDPRRELSDNQALLGLMLLISSLESANCKVLYSHCGSELLLIKAAGASSCATGKFFNLRRFTKGRFEEPEDDGGGGQLAYWFEHGLLSFLRGADIFRLRSENLNDYICNGPSDNIIAHEILTQFVNDPGKAWVALGWKQYLSWFANVEGTLDKNNDPIKTVSNWLKEAEDRWGNLEDKEILLEERRNDGRWIRPWRQALSDFKKVIS